MLIADFGLSTSIDYCDTVTATHIRERQTVPFSAPELLLGEVMDPARSDRVRSKTTMSDIYAYGGLIYQVCTAYALVRQLKFSISLSCTLATRRGGHSLGNSIPRWRCNSLSIAYALCVSDRLDLPILCYGTMSGRSVRDLGLTRRKNDPVYSLSCGPFHAQVARHSSGTPCLTPAYAAESWTSGWHACSAANSAAIRLFRNGARPVVVREGLCPALPVTLSLSHRSSASDQGWQLLFSRTSPVGWS